MFEIVCIGASLIDFYIQSDQFSLAPSDSGVLLCSRYGGKIDVDNFNMMSGGGASNTAVGFARQGFNTAVITELGRDALAEVVLEDFINEKVETAWVIKEKREETGMSVVLVAPEGGRTVMVHRGASSMLEQSDIPWLELEECRWIHVSNVSGQLDLLQKLFFMVSPLPTISMSWNPGKADLSLLSEGKLQISAGSVEVFSVNKEEWESISSVQKSILQTVPIVIVTDGRNGGMVIENGTKLHNYPILEVKNVDETGSGDAFLVGFVTAYMRGEGIEAGIELGRKNSASVVQAIGAKKGLLRRT